MREIIEMRIAGGLYAGESPQAYLDERMAWGRSVETKSITHELSDGRFIHITRQPLSGGGWVATHEDVTRNKRMERLKNEFVSVVSHELRTPLTSLSGSLLLLNSDGVGELPDDAKSLVDVAIRNSKRLAMLVDDILDIEKIRSDKMEFNFAVKDVVEVAREAISENAAYAAEHGVTFKLDARIGAAHARIDAGRLNQVFANLLSNAAKFSPSDAVVVLRITRESEALRFAVIDEGCGIPSTRHAELFERFVQVDTSDTRERRGTGLGLAIVKAILEGHGAQIHVDSQVGKGSTFYFDLEEVAAPFQGGVGAGVRSGATAA